MTRTTKKNKQLDSFSQALVSESMETTVSSPGAMSARGTSAWTRRKFIGAWGASMLFPLVYARAAAPPPTHPLASFDREIEQFMEARKVPGGALAVVKDGRLVYARGYGWADRDRKIPARPDSLFRIASVSKPITAVAVLKLVEAGRLDLNARAFDLVPAKPVLAAGREPDPRLAGITIRQLLHHTGGWDRDKSFDPMFRPKLIAETVGTPAPANPAAIIRYMLGQPLDFDPGARYAYSNFGYCVLGRVIERITGMSYEQYVKTQILAPMGIRRMRIGATLRNRQAKGEVCYYTSKDAEANSVFPAAPGKVPWPYGGFNLEAMDAHGGWIASAVDLGRFAAVLDEPRRSPLRNPESFRTMYSPPEAPVARNVDGTLKDSFYGCGWSVRPVKKADKANYWHNGSLPGTATLLVRRWDGLSWAVLFNQRSEDRQMPDGAIDSAMHRAADAVTDWPKENLFRRYS